MIHIRPQAEDSEDKSELDAENRAFNETLKRMLKTPPNPHGGDAKKSKEKAEIEPKPTPDR